MRERKNISCRIEGSLPLRHKKNPRILRSKTAGFLHKNQLARGLICFVAGAFLIF